MPNRIPKDPPFLFTAVRINTTVSPKGLEEQYIYDTTFPGGRISGIYVYLVDVVVISYQTVQQSR